MATGTETNGEAPSRRGTWMVLLFAFLLYLPSLANGFAMDGEGIASSKCNTRPGPDPVITAEYDTSKLDYLAKFFRNHYWWPESANDGLYRPIAVMSYGLVYQCFGRFLPAEREALPQHLVNVLAHVWGVWLVMQLLVAVGAPRMVTLLSALLFAVHAIHSEVVAGVIGRSETLSFCFGAQAMLLMARGGWRRLALAGLAMFGAYGSKESSFCWIPFWFCFALTRQWSLRPDAATFATFKEGRTWLAVVALVVPAIAWYALRARAMQLEPLIEQAADFSSNPLAHVSAGVRILTAIKVWGYGLWLCVAPFKLSCIYSPLVFDMVESPLDPWFLVSAAALLGMLGLGVWRARRQPLVFFAMTCFLGFAFVTSNVPLPIGTIFGERLYYTPSLGVCVLVAASWPFLRGRGVRVFLVAVALWCAANVVMAVHRTQVWENSGTLFTNDVRVYPDSIDLHRKVAAVYTSDGPQQDFDKALQHLEEARRLFPEYAHAYRQMGKVYVRKKEWKKAIEAFEKSYEVDYYDPPGAESIAYNSIGDCLRGLAEGETAVAAKRKYIGEAMGWYRKTLAAPPWGDSILEANNKIGDSYLQLGELESTAEAKRRFRRTALDWFAKSVTEDSLQQLAAREALKRIFKHSVDPDVVWPPDRVARIYGLAHSVAGSDHELTLLMGVAAYKAKLPTEFVYSPLHWALANYPEEKRDRNYWIAQLFYTDALFELGEARAAIQILQTLLGRPELDEPTKQQIRTKLRSLHQP